MNLATPEALTDLFRSLINESDRGCVILVATFLDDLLRTMHEAKIRSLSSATEGQLKDWFNYQGPLGTFSARIQLAYAYGFIEKSAFDDLERLRKLRNDAAHLSEPFEFDRPELRARIRKLSFSARIGEVEPGIKLLPEEAQAVDNPVDNAWGAKMHLLLVGMFLGVSILRDAWNELKERVRLDDATADPAMQG